MSAIKGSMSELNSFQSLSLKSLSTSAISARSHRVLSGPVFAFATVRGVPSAVRLSVAFAHIAHKCVEDTQCELLFAPAL